MASPSWDRGWLRTAPEREGSERIGFASSAHGAARRGVSSRAVPDRGVGTSSVRGRAHWYASLIIMSPLTSANPSLLGRIRSLPRAERWLLATSFVLVASVRSVLRLLPSPVIVRVVRALASRPVRRQAGRWPASTIVWAVDAAGRRVPGASCLTRALSAMILLRHYGHASILRLGVARGPDQRFRAHAWLEGDAGILIGRAGTDRLMPLPAFEAAPRGASREPQ